ncbi:hypothetical protein HXY32_03505 [Candidatus Bathyarchaeota archaeon]|nr:hypothetical protein [Candidatus Bathyarchaeota archaeon]
MKNRNKGQIRIIEAFLAVLIIFSSFAVSSNLTIRQSTKRSEYLASVGFQALMKLDSDGSLGKYIDDGNWAALRDAFSMVLPAGICFNLTVYNGQMQQLNNVTISNVGFSSQQIAFVEYLSVTREPSFRCYILHLTLAVAT